MGATSIEWTDATWQVTAGCSRVSPGCQACYAERMSGRLAAMAVADTAAGRDPGKKKAYLQVVNQRAGRGLDGYGPLSGWNHKVIPLPDNLTEPLGWKRPRRIFVNSQSDLFHEQVPFDFVDRVFAVMALTPHHTFQILTKRPGRMADYLARRPASTSSCDDPIYESARRVGVGVDQMVALAGRLYGSAPGWPLPNAWLGTSVEDQQRADERIPHLLRCPAAVRFLSCEPLLGPVSLREWARPLGVSEVPGSALNDGADACSSFVRNIGIDWVIVGGESGPGARPMHPDWARDLRDQCQAAGVAYFFKQWGEWRPFGASGEDTTKAASDACSTNRWRWIDRDGDSGWTVGCEGREPMIRVGKGAAGRLLDGRTWSEFPKAAGMPWTEPEARA